MSYLHHKGRIINNHPLSPLETIFWNSKHGKKRNKFPGYEAKKEDTLQAKKETKQTKIR